jgi:hypothetical protein
MKEPVRRGAGRMKTCSASYTDHSRVGVWSEGRNTDPSREDQWNMILAGDEQPNPVRGPV